MHRMERRRPPDTGGSLASVLPGSLLAGRGLLRSGLLRSSALLCSGLLRRSALLGGSLLRRGLLCGGRFLGSRLLRRSYFRRPFCGSAFAGAASSTLAFLRLHVTFSHFYGVLRVWSKVSGAQYADHSPNVALANAFMLRTIVAIGPSITTDRPIHQYLRGFQNADRSSADRSVIPSRSPDRRSPAPVGMSTTRRVGVN